MIIGSGFFLVLHVSSLCVIRFFSFLFWSHVERGVGGDLFGVCLLGRLCCFVICITVFRTSFLVMLAFIRHADNTAPLVSLGFCHMKFHLFSAMPMSRRG